jgi:hypothetical protein
MNKTKDFEIYCEITYNFIYSLAIKLIMSNVIVTGGGPPKKRPRRNDAVPSNLSLISAATKDDSCKVATASNITTGNDGLNRYYEWTQIFNYFRIHSYKDVKVSMYIHVYKLIFRCIFLFFNIAGIEEKETYLVLFVLLNLITRVVYILITLCSVILVKFSSVSNVSQ